ncbi:type II toxin-antitoxin system prevent-host-death family antitoxin [Terrarubrum flagellatum]|uniref:type II toxin-antitoxin system Phd/YefM family antitoxin n=1 Tax=Terrirubrum flagellatum TaxID=2895980 RepID=UPI003144E15F
MKTITYSSLRQNLSAVLDQVSDDREPIIVTRSNGRAAVLMSLEDFASYEETRHLAASPANRKRLLAAIHEFEKGGGTERNLAE